MKKITIELSDEWLNENSDVEKVSEKSGIFDFVRFMAVNAFKNGETESVCVKSDRVEGKEKELFDRTITSLIAIGLSQLAEEKKNEQKRVEDEIKSVGSLAGGYSPDERDKKDGYTYNFE